MFSHFLNVLTMLPGYKYNICENEFVCVIENNISSVAPTFSVPQLFLPTISNCFEFYTLEGPVHFYSPAYCDRTNKDTVKLISPLIVLIKKELCWICSGFLLILFLYLMQVYLKLSSHICIKLIPYHLLQCVI